MTTDWCEMSRISRIKPCYFTDNMKECFVYDNPNGHTIRELMLMLNASQSQVMDYFDNGLYKYRYSYKKGGKSVNAKRYSEVV